MKVHKKRVNPTIIIAAGFMIIILIGCFLLSLPVSSRNNEWTSFSNSLLTSSSATCVTGLAAFDTYTHWSAFGQAVILTLIQIGGLGFMSVLTMLSIALKRQIGLSERKLIMQSTAVFAPGGVVKLMKRIVIGTFSAEAIGAFLLSFRFCRDFGILRGIYFSIFHSVSAFCNAGFDLFGYKAAGASLSLYKYDLYVNIVIMLLIIFGGLGFIVWMDILENKFRFSAYKLHSKLMLATTLILIIIPAILFFVFEYNNAFKGESTAHKILLSFFSSVSPRTAGFSTYNLCSLSDSGSVLTMALMLIGGGPGSTAGGIKVTTIAVLAISLISAAKQTPQTVAFKRRIDENTIHHASSVFVVYISIFIVSVMTLCAIEPFSLKEIMFEVASAIGTVGLTMNVTPLLTNASKIFISILMYIGRLGGLTLVVLLVSKSQSTSIVSRPLGKVIVG